ncbi:hypothetical protein D3874_21765 [Oleomonas cavernae]|uniref:Uncharacterized protein n=4 Tax=Oleomonas cavernae TaxID=2320859 RepID=A0A418VTF3_9PROT|nr:hypothetical protein D3874_27665 [Oleomonas cavernae]RJF89272.1 hypothetical protein D3874_21765 [Oleomonas cavernae]
MAIDLSRPDHKASALIAWDRLQRRRGAEASAPAAAAMAMLPVVQESRERKLRMQIASALLLLIDRVQFLTDHVHSVVMARIRAAKASPPEIVRVPKPRARDDYER